MVTMKRILLKLSLVFFVFFTSCKDNSNEGKVIASNELSADFKINLSTVFKVNGYIHLYFNENNDLHFTEQNSIWMPVKASEFTQESILTLPKGKYPKQIRLDFTTKTNQQKVVLKKVQFSYHNRTFVVSDKHVFKYFRGDKTNTKVDIIGGVLTTTKPESKTVSLYPNPDKVAEVLKELKK